MTELSFAQGWQAARAEIQAAIELQKAERLSQMPREALEWLALLPAWTVGLAEACGFPVEDAEGIRGTLLHIHELGLCQHAPGTPSDPSLERFWMSSEQRAAQLSKAIQAHESGRGQIRATIGNLAERVRRAGSSGVPLLPIVERWVTLAEGQDPGGIGRRLLDQAEREPPARVARWLEAARPLEEIFKGEVTAAFLRALRRMEYEDRREADRRMLRKYVVRPSQLQDFEELLSGPDDLWGLHYVGAGGVGKTMLMRHLSVERIPALGGTSARIDFDHINPDYPSRAPGLLLVQLAEELRLQAPSGAAEDLFASFFDKMTTLHEQLGSKPSLTPEDPLDSPMLGFALDLMAEAMQRLPQPVVLLLDTCEELSKVQLDGKLPRNVSATFRILEGMHLRYPRLRVVFCGRRLLGTEGHGWRVAADPPVERPSLRLHVMRGFDREEAEAFLDSSGVPKGLQEAILSRSAAAGFSVQGTGRAAPRPGDQYSPYSLDLHATWVRDRPDLMVEEILDNRVDPFVRIRILSRLPASLESLLPAVALLGVFDQPTLLAATGFDLDEFDALFRELADQEWVVRLGGGLVEVEPEMRTRLLQHIRATHGPELDRIRRRGIDHLKRKTVRDSGKVPVSELDPSEFEVALRLLEPYPEEAAEWWERVELGLARAGADDWAESLTRRLLADGAVAGPRAEGENPLRPAILATLAAALTRLRSGIDIAVLWDEVLKKASRHPLPRGAEILRLRATAALTSAGVLGLEDLDRTLWEVCPTGPDLQEAASVIAAIEQITERLEGETGKEEQAAHLGDLAGRLIGPVQKLDLGLNAFLRTLAARLCLLQGRAGKAREHFSAALGIGQNLDSTRRDWLDWAPPANLYARINLEFVRGAWARLLPADEVLEKLVYVPPLAGDADTDRLASANQQLAGAVRVPEIDPLFLALVTQEVRPVCRAHQEFLPLFAAEARAAGDAGRASEALEALGSQERMYEATAMELENVLEADRARMYLAFRMRLRPQDGPSPSSLLLSPSAPPEDQDLAARWLATLPPSERAHFSFDTTMRTWLRYRPLEEDLRKILTEQAATLQVPHQNRPQSLDELRQWVEALEIGQLARENRLPVLLLKPPADMAWNWQDLLLRLTPTSFVAASLLRAWSLLGTPKLPDTLAHHLGIRRAAWIALDEGTLLSWRSPAAGERLLESSARWFEASQDVFGATLAWTSLCLAYSRRPEGHLQAMRSALARLRTNYELFREQNPAALASWDEVSAFPSQRDVDPHELGPSLWLPWLLRIASCIAWFDDGYQADTHTGRLLAALGNLYGESGGGVTLPPELEFLRAKALPKSPASYSVNTLESEPEPPQREEVRVRFSVPGSVRLEIWPPQPQQEIPLLVEVDSPGSAPLKLNVSMRPGFDPYLALAERTPWIADLRKRMRAGSDRVLEVDASLRWICWEALLSLDPEFPDFRENLLRVCRWTVAKASVKAASRWAARASSVELAVLAPSLGDVSMSRAGWASLPSWFLVQYPRVQGLLDNPPPEMAAARIVHGIGRPTSTTGGARLAVGEGYQTSTSGRGHLVAPRDLLMLSPRAQLFILQADSKKVPDRSGSDREQASYLRHMAAELQSLGVPAVLVLPSLPQEQGTEVLLDIAGALRNGPDLLPNLLQALADARAFLLDNSQSLRPDDRREQALDITLFATDNLEWNLPEGS